MKIRKITLTKQKLVMFKIFKIKPKRKKELHKKKLEFIQVQVNRMSKKIIRVDKMIQLIFVINLDY
jgi:hypothetical protein